MSSDFNDLPNPFAQLANSGPGASSKQRKKKNASSSAREPNWSVDGRPGRAKRSVVRAAKYLIAVMICFGVLLGIRHATGHWLLTKLTQDFDQLTAAQQHERLLQIEGLGKPAIPHMVDAMAAKEIATARTAYELLRHSQNEWTTLRPSERHGRHLILAESIRGVSARLPDDRTGWAASLLQQSIMDSVSQTDELEKSVYHHAHQALSSLALSTRSGPSILDGEYTSANGGNRRGGILKPKIATGDLTSDDPAILRNRRLAVSATPLPIEQDPNATRWSDWPPTAEPANLNPPTGDRSEVYRSTSMKLRPVKPDDPVILRPVETSFGVASADSVAAVNHDEDLPLEAYNDRSVMHWLVSSHANLRNKAAIELQSRGYSDRELEMAQHMVHADTKVRLAFLDHLTRDREMDPRPWLRMMAEDESREVRLRVVSILATMNDHATEDYLRTLRVQERDPTVAARIRRVLKLR